MRSSLKIGAVAALGVALAILVEGYVRAEREQARLDAHAARNNRAFARALASAIRATAERDGAQRARKLLADIDAREASVDVHWVPESHARRAGGMSDAMTTRGALTSRIPLWLDGPGQLVVHRDREATREPFAWLATDALRAAAALALLATVIIVATMVWLVGLPLHVLVVQARQLGGSALVRGGGIRPSGDLGEVAGGIYGLGLQLARVRAEVSRLSADRRALIERVRDADRAATLGRLAAGLIRAFVSRLAVLEAGAASLAKAPRPVERAHSDAERMFEDATDLSRALRSLLVFAEPASGRRPVLDLRPLVANVAELLAGEAGARQVDLCIASDREAVEAPVCPAQMQHLLAALVLNAIDAQPAGGTVRIAAYSNCRAYLPQGLKVGASSYVCLVVDDQGVGMTPEVQGRMFDPFFTTKRLGDRIGLGLAAVARIVEDHRGFIGVETAPRAGTRMTVFIPR